MTSLPLHSSERAEADWPHRVVLVASSGGHLTQLLRLRQWWQTRQRSWVCFDTPDAQSSLRDEQTVWAHHPTTRNILNLARNLWLAQKVLRSERPDVVVSDGAGVAVPFFLTARAMGIATVYIEVFDRIDTPTLTGRLCAPFTDLMLVQWEEQLKLYDNAVYLGPLL